MDNKYYTPSVEEFYIGFECEIYNSNNEWFPILFTKGHLYNDLKFIDKFEDNLENSFRVKYLDKEDIESLGWVLINEIRSPFTNKLLDRFMINKEHGFNTGDNWFLNEQDNNWNIKSTSYSSYGSAIQDIQLKIKNKSELKVLMKQLGI